MLRAIGLDLGTSKAVVTTLHRGEPQVILNREHSPLTSALLSLGAGGELLIGQAAREERGRATESVQPFRPALAPAVAVLFNGLQYTPGELMAVFLLRLKQDAEAALGEPVERAVLATPVCLGRAQVMALRAAAEMAGLLVTRIIHSPIAAALAYSIAHPNIEPQTILVFDLGAGHLDVAVLRRFHGALTALGLAGENWLGGDDLTESVVAHLIRCLQSTRGLLLDETQQARHDLRRRLRPAAEQAKVALSFIEQIKIRLPGKAIGLPVGIAETLARAQLAEIIRPRLEEGLAVAERALATGRLSREDIQGLLLVGGSSQIPLLQTLLGERFHRARFLQDFNPLLGVALGAALFTGVPDEVRCPVCRLANPVEARICRACRGPLFGKVRVACPRCFLPNDPGRQICWKCGASLRPFAAQRPAQPATRPCPRCGAPVAAGRTVCSACLAPQARRTRDGLRCRRCGSVPPAGAPACPACGEAITPFIGAISSRSLGIELSDGRLDILLPEGSSLPGPEPVYRTFYTVGAGNRYLEVTLYEGDKPIARENSQCGRLRLALPEDLPPDTAVRVAFSLDADGLPAVNAWLARDPAQEVEVQLIIEPVS